MNETEIEGVLAAARAAYDDGDLDVARTGAARALAMLGSRRGELADDLRIDAQMMLAAVSLELGEAERALEHARAAQELLPGDGEAMYFEARARLLLWQLDEADDLLRRCQPPDVLRGAVAYHRAITADARGRFADADALYEKAARLDPEFFPRPVRMDEEEARTLLADLVHSFPPDVRATLDNTRIEITEMPDPVLDGAASTDPLLLGLYTGVPIGDQSDVPVGMPGSVRIFKRNIERLAADPDELREQLRITLLHEVGHHLGWDEDDLEERGLA